MLSKKELLQNAVVTQNTTEKTNLLGYVFWFSIGEANYKREDMESSMIQNGLDINFLPKPVNPVDAFARASRECEVKSWKAHADSEEYKNFMVRDVVRAGENHVKRIVVETVNSKREVLSHDAEAAVLRFNTKSGVMSTECNDPNCLDLLNHAEQVFEEYVKVHNGNTVRGSIQRLLNTLSPILMRATGGVYFVPIKYEDEILATVRYINSLVKGDAATMPVVNNAEGQMLIKRKLEEHLQGVIENCKKAILANEDLTIMPERKRKDLEKTALETAMLAIHQFKDYKEILEGELSQVEAAFNLVKSSVTKMTEELLIKPVKKRN